MKRLRVRAWLATVAVFASFVCVGFAAEKGTVEVVSDLLGQIQTACDANDFDHASILSEQLRAALNQAKAEYADAEIGEESAISITAVIGRTLEEVEDILGPYSLVVGQHGNIWTGGEWVTARRLDLASEYLHYIEREGMEMKVSVRYTSDTSKSRLHPIERVEVADITFDRDVPLASLFTYFPELQRAVLGVDTASVPSYGSGYQFTLATPIATLEFTATSSIAQASDAKLAKLRKFAVHPSGYVSDKEIVLIAAGIKPKVIPNPFRALP
jgi:hypothetical protein